MTKTCYIEELHKWEVRFMKGTLEYTVRNISAFTPIEAEIRALKYIPRGSTYTLIYVKDEGALS